MNTVSPKFHVTATFNGIYSFYECLLFIVNGIQSLGYEVKYADNKLDPDAINVVLGSYRDLSHLNSWTRLSQEASNIIIYNWEQAAVDVPWFTQRYLRQMTHAHVWDYNLSNISKLKEAGIYDIHHVPMAYVPEMRKVASNVEQDIDVLFYGLINPRRLAVIEALRKKGLNVLSTADRGWMSGDERDELISRSKIVLNIHFFDVARVFEIARVSYLLANSKAVVSEIAPMTDIDDDIRASVIGGSVAELPQLCWELVNDDARRHEIERKGFELFSQRNAASILKPAIDRYLAQSRATPPALGNPPQHSTPLPKTLHIGAGEHWNFSYCNIDAEADFAPDLALDIGSSLPFSQTLDSWRFGRVQLERNYFEKIIAKNVFQTIPNLKLALTNCLELLQEGGTLDLTVPLDMSIGNWTGANDCRLFNEQTWYRIINDWWQYGWNTHRFEPVHSGYGLNNAYGVDIIKNNGGDWDKALLIPRAIDTINIILRKQPLTEKEKEQLPKARFLD